MVIGLHIYLISVLKVTEMNGLTTFLGFLAIASGASVPCRERPGTGYIVGGKDTNITEVPYQVALNFGSRFICGGSIISATHILTAAHCVSSKAFDKNIYNIRAGSTMDKQGGVVVYAKKVSFHPKFSMRTIDYDVAVIELLTPLNFSSSIKPIKLTDKEVPDGEPVKVSGWGCIKEGGVRSHKLQSVIVPMVNRKTCEKQYRECMQITPRMICAGVEGKDACQGDSGGPLAYKDKIVGIVSTGEGCARKDFPGIYTNVADTDIRKFIKEHANI